MVDIHDRRPVVFTPGNAQAWLESGAGEEQAGKLAVECSQPTENFECYPVDVAVGNVKNQGPGLIER